MWRPSRAQFIFGFPTVGSSALAGFVTRRYPMFRSCGAFVPCGDIAFEANVTYPHEEQSIFKSTSNRKVIKTGLGLGLGRYNKYQFNSTFKPKGD